jgi:hypothetical protein
MYISPGVNVKLRLLVYVPYWPDPGLEKRLLGGPAWWAKCVVSTRPSLDLGMTVRQPGAPWLPDAVSDWYRQRTQRPRLGHGKPATASSPNSHVIPLGSHTANRAAPRARMPRRRPATGDVRGGPSAGGGVRLWLYFRMGWVRTSLVLPHHLPSPSVLPALTRASPASTRA